MKKDKERKEEEVKRVEIQEEEKKSKYLFYDEVLSLDDSDLDGNHQKLERQVKRFNKGRFGQLKSTMDSTHNHSNHSNNNRLKQVKSSNDIMRTGMIQNLKRESSENIS